jgi:hypothetical protein
MKPGDGAMPNATCNCGHVRIRTNKTPVEVTECNCAICQEMGARWAYYSAAEVRIETAGATRPFFAGDRMLAFHRCRTCGCATHWQSLDATRPMAVNAVLLEGIDWDQMRVRHFDGADTRCFLD